MQEIIKKLISENIESQKNLLSGDTVSLIQKAAQLIVSSLQKGGKILIFGNGGSAADSQHMAAELVGRFKKERRAIPAIALTTNTSILTALANDYGYDIIFSRQIEALGNKNDVVLGISTSGNAKNVLEGVLTAKKLGIPAIILSGKDGGKLTPEADLAIVVKSLDTPRIQESHILIIHILCELIENEMAKK